MGTPNESLGQVDLKNILAPLKYGLRDPLGVFKGTEGKFSEFIWLP